MDETFDGKLLDWRRLGTGKDMTYYGKGSDYVIT